MRQFGGRVAYFIDYAFAVFALCSIDFKDVYFFWIFAFKLSYFVPGLIYRCISVEKTGKFFPVFLLVLFDFTLEFCSGFFLLDEVLLAIGFPEYFIDSFSFASQCLQFTAPPGLGEVFFYFYHWLSIFCGNLNFFL